MGRTHRRSFNGNRPRKARNDLGRDPDRSRTATTNPVPATKCICRKQAWVLKNSFRGISPTKFARKLLNVRSPQTLKSTEITALVPFSTATGVLTTLRLLFARQAKGKRKIVIWRCFSHLHF